MTERDQERGRRWRSRGKAGGVVEGVKGIALHPQCSEAVIHEDGEMK